MIAAYASCQSYMDTGQVKTVYLTQRGRRTEVRPFSTAFVRPDAFRFEFQNRRGEEEWDRYIVWKQGVVIKSWWTLKPEGREFAELSLAIAGATGVSGGSSCGYPVCSCPIRFVVTATNC
jgi:hypothetical protein